MNTQIYPWQTQQWQQLMTSREQNRLPHAILLVGAEGLGKKHFAEIFAQTLLCQQAQAPCGCCHACALCRAQSHPDLLWVEPEADARMIKIDQIREAVEFTHQTALQNGVRVMIIHPAHAMNTNAANALLKTLEEPPPNVIIILISDPSLRLSATILSRCQKVIFSKPVHSLALDWLKTHISENDLDLNLLLNLADGSPLLARQILENGRFALRQELYQGLELLTQRQADPLQLASQFQEQDLILVFNLLFLWLKDMLRFKLIQSECVNSDYRHVFAKITQNVSCAHLLNLIDHTKKIYTHLLHSLNLNRQLVLEEFFIRWNALYAS